LPRFELLLQLFDGDLACRHFRTEQSVKEIRPAQSRDFGSLALRNHATVVPKDRGGEPELSRELLVRIPERQRRIVG